MGTDPKKPHDDGSQRRPSGAESKGEARGKPGGHRSPSGSDYGDWVPDRDQTKDDLDADDAEAKAESNRNKDFDTTHVHSSTTSRKV